MTDESTLVIPEEWHRSVHPRRGGRVPATLKVAANPGTRAARLVAKAEEAGVFAALAPEASDADLIERTRRHLRGEADPAGAAVVAQLAAMETSSPDNALRTFVDAWAAEHGPAFAACAVMELASIRVKRLPDGSRHAEQRSAARVGDDDFDFTGRGCARRVRTLLAGADDADYREAAERLEEHRDTRVRRLLAAYLVPTRHEWVAQCCEEGPDDTWKWRSGERRALFLSLGAREHVEAVEGKIWPTWREVDAELATTLLDGLGADALPLLVSASGLPVGDATRRRVLETVSVIPTDEALAALLERHDGKIARPVLLAAMTRFPMRALRLLTRAVVDLNAAGDAEGAAAMTDLLQGQVLNHPDAAARTMDELPDPCRAVLEPVLSSAVRLPEAPLEALPPLLARPPWEQGRTKAEPVVIPELTPAVEAGVTWQEGERERWAAFPLPEPPADADWEELAARYRDGRLPRQEALALFTAGPEEIVRPLLAAGAEDGPWIEGGDAARLRSILARHELDALPAALSAARARPAVFADLLVPFLDARVAKLMVEWFHGTGPLRDVALRWLDRHGVQAARLLIPTALDRHAHAPRRAAERALLAFSLRLGEEPIIAAAREHGDRAADAIAELLTVGPPDLLPAKRPKSVPWIVPARLPQVPLRGDKDKALPLTAIGHVITLLTLSAPYGVHPGVDLVRELCDPESLAEFSWALFQEWRKTGEPTEGYWALHQLAWFGDDETARRLTPVIRAWPGQSGHRKAVAGLDVLTAIGSDAALLQLHGISEKVKFTGLREAARSKIHRLGETLGLSADQLADRLVPAFGLDPDGTLTLDYGPRRFTVGFDEQLKPYVTDESGKRRKTLPKPGAKDDPQLAPAAHKRFTELKKDVRTVASTQVRRLERAMVLRRRWTPEEFRELFVEHPLVWHIARRLVWLAETGEGATAFRIAEDRTLADAEDETLTLPAQATVGIAHPIDLGEDVPVWSEVFADYEIVQPFPQLMRQVHALTDEERTSGRLPRFEGVTVPGYTVLGLTRRGWERGAPLDNGVERWISKPVPGGLHVVIDLDPGIWVGVRGDDQEDQTLDTVWINDRPDDFWSDDRIRHSFGELDPVTASEVLADLAWLAGHAR